MGNVGGIHFVHAVSKASVEASVCLYAAPFLYSDIGRCPHYFSFREERFRPFADRYNLFPVYGAGNQLDADDAFYAAA